MNRKVLNLVKKNIILVSLSIISIYQCTIQLIDYLNYKSLVNVKVPMPTFTRMPAISLCTHSMQGISIDYLKNIYPDLRNEILDNMNV
jgi:hypothetical protein